MKACILAAGIGSRLRPLTDDKPKCLVRVCDKAILDYQLDAYRAAAVEEVVLVTGYRSDAVREHVRHVRTPRVRLVENNEYESTNNMYSLSLAAPYLEGKPFLLSNADVAVSPDIVTKLVTHHTADAILVDLGSHDDESMKVRGTTARLAGISKEFSQAAALGRSVDFYKFSAETSAQLFDVIWSTLGRGDVNSWTEVAINELLSRHGSGFSACPTGSSRWLEIDTIPDLLAAEATFSPFDRTMRDVEVVFVDLDGTLFVGETPVDGAADAVRRFVEAGTRVFFLSNNSSRDKVEYVRKLSRYGIPVEPDQIILSTDGAIRWLQERDARGVYVVGTAALVAQVQAHGLDVRGPKDAEYVLVGYDTELTYAKLRDAAVALNSGSILVSTHPDVHCPTEQGPIPDAGAIVACLATTTGKQPVAVFGKPNTEMIQHVMTGVDPRRVAVIGDRPYTDLDLARRIGAASVLVLSGETALPDIEHLGWYPTAVVPSIAALG